MGNLPLDVAENAIRGFFSECGDVRAIRLIRDSRTGVGKGFGFVSFASRDGVVLALEKNGDSFEGREIRVMKAGKQAGGNREDRREAVGKRRVSKERRDKRSRDAEAAEAGSDGEAEGKKRKKEKKGAKGGFAGERSEKREKKRKKAKQEGKGVAGRKRQAIARLLTA